MGVLEMKSILFILASASVAVLVISAPSKNSDLLRNVEENEILEISKRSINDKQRLFASNARTGHSGAAGSKKKIKQIEAAEKRREERRKNRLNKEKEEKNETSG